MYQYMHVHTFKSGSRNIREAIEDQVESISVDSRIREQEFGNLQGDDFKLFRQEQQKVGRFWYRFPTGESGADVFVRVSQWFHHALLLGEAQWAPDGQKSQLGCGGLERPGNMMEL